MKNEVTTLAQDYIAQQSRVRKVLSQYESLGQTGMFGAMMIRDVLRRSESALASGDTVAMLKIHAEMKDVR